MVTITRGRKATIKVEKPAKKNVKGVGIVITWVGGEINKMTYDIADKEEIEFVLTPEETSTIPSNNNEIICQVTHEVKRFLRKPKTVSAELIELNVEEAVKKPTSTTTAAKKKPSTTKTNTAKKTTTNKTTNKTTSTTKKATTKQAVK